MVIIYNSLILEYNLLRNFDFFVVDTFLFVGFCAEAEGVCG
jgi:hypothetical protein